MSHQAQVYINNVLFPGISSSSVIESHSLNQIEANSLMRHLKNDATSYIYSSVVSIGDAILGIRKEFLTWATVKLYYATFYALRSLLAANGICVFYIKTSPSRNTPFILEAQPGKMAKKSGIGQTHKLVLEEFKRRSIEPFLLSQNIGFQNPLEWMVEKREEANYKNARFYEPLIPKHFEKIINSGTRRVVQGYLNDASGLYVFDPDHAILAYPLKVVQIAYKKISTSGDFALRSEEVSYLCQLFIDQNGPIPEVYTLLKNP